MKMFFQRILERFLRMEPPGETGKAMMARLRAARPEIFASAEPARPAANRAPDLPARRRRKRKERLFRP